MDVRTRSYGTPVTMLYRAPHTVQFVNGYPNRRFPDSDRSRVQSGQIAVSTGINESFSPLRLCKIRKSTNRRRSGSRRTSCITAIDGSLRRSSAKKRSASRSTTTSTSEPLFTTYPCNPRLVATRYTVGRKPTPCTTPLILNRSADVFTIHTQNPNKYAESDHPTASGQYADRQPPSPTPHPSPHSSHDR